MAHYNFITCWRLDAPIERVWNALEDANSWPLWWKGVVSVTELEKGSNHGVGSIRAFTFKSFIPYPLTFNMRVVNIEPLKRIEGVAYGELQGVGIWNFKTENGHTVIQYIWQVQTTRLWMNALAPIARPIFKWNHDVIMRWGGRGLAQRLNCRLIPA